MPECLVKQADLIIDIVQRMMLYKDRSEILPTNHADKVKLYSWMYRQPDKEDLMKLMILLKFNHMPFIELVLTQNITFSLMAYEKKGDLNGTDDAN